MADWSVETTLEFLDLYGRSPVIWDQQHEDHKNRYCVTEAWNEIEKELSVETTVDILKRKKESLMSTYRMLKKKVVASQGSGDTIYIPSWFAFKIMDKYLKHSVNITGKPAVKAETVKGHDVSEYDSGEDRSEITEVEELSSDREIETKANSFHTERSRNNKRKVDPFTTDIGQNIKSACETLRIISNRKRQAIQDSDECALYGQLIATKLRKLSKRSRLSLMNKIDNMVYQSEIEELERV